MEIFVGIDPSINSTGITIHIYDGEEKIKEHFYIITGNKLTKKQELEPEKYIFFDYLLYNKLDIKDAVDNHQAEEFKTFNFIYIIDNLCDAINKNIMYVNNVLNSCVTNIYVVMEGISYGSTLKTKSVFDLAGLNYMIRQRLYNIDNIKLFISPPGEIKKFASGMGNANKNIMVKMFEATYPNFRIKKIDDIADSFYMAKYARKIYLENK